jgi:hypothetical protein
LIRGVRAFLYPSYDPAPNLVESELVSEFEKISTLIWRESAIQFGGKI